MAVFYYVVLFTYGLFPMIRVFLVAGMAIMTSGCTAVMSNVQATLEYAFQTKTDVELSAEQIEDLPYTAKYIERHGEPRIMLVLGYIDGENKTTELSWITADRETLVTRRGRVVRSNGLSLDLLAHTAVTADPLKCIQDAMSTAKDTAHCASRSRRAYDFRHGTDNYSLTSTSTFEIGESEVIELPAYSVSAVKVTERGEFSPGRHGATQQFVNHYWLEHDGHVVKSIQQWHPTMEPMMLTQVKWVGRTYE